MNRSRVLRLRTAVVLVLGALCLLALVPGAADAKTYELGAGKASFSLDPNVTTSLLLAGIAPYAVSPAKLSFGASSVKFSMPVREGTWHTTPAVGGRFLLRGGLMYLRGSSGTFHKLTLSGWRAGVNTNAGFSISAAGVRSAPFFDQNLMGSTSSIVTIHGHKYVKVTNVILLFNATSAAAMTSALGVSPGAGDAFGSVTFLVRVKT